MQDLKKNKRRMMSQHMAQMAANLNIEEESITEDTSRGCKPKHGHGCFDDNTCDNGHHKNECKCECKCECDCNKHDHDHDCDCNKHNHDCDDHHKNECRPCELESDECIKNVCGPECCDPIAPRRFSINNSIPIAIETNRIFDTMQFQMFTDAVNGNGETIDFVLEVVDVNGTIPRGGQVSVVIDEICLNHDGIEITPGLTTLEDFELDPDSPIPGKVCETAFEYSVCGRRNANCCRQGRNKSVGYKERGLTARVLNLVLELRGRCGCTEFTALAFPALNGKGGSRKRCDHVEFRFNTLSAPICLPADGRAVTLRQDYQTSLTVDCIDKALLCMGCCDGEKFFELDIPNGIDLVLCVKETVSTLISEQIVVLGSPHQLEPRLVDSFSQVCNFDRCGPRSNRNDNGRDNGNNNEGSCGCSR